jgi:hypothetical protein
MNFIFHCSSQIIILIQIWRFGRPQPHNLSPNCWIPHLGQLLRTLPGGLCHCPAWSNHTFLFFHKSSREWCQNCVHTVAGKYHFFENRDTNLLCTLSAHQTSTLMFLQTLWTTWGTSRAQKSVILLFTFPVNVNHASYEKQMGSGSWNLMATTSVRQV